MQERKKGNVFQSRDLISGVMVLISFMALRMLAGYMMDRFYTILIDFISFSQNITDFNINAASRLIYNFVLNVLLLALPILLVALVLGVVMSLAQTRMTVAEDALKPKFSRLNPISGLKKMFSLKSIVELLKSLLKIAVIIAIVYYVIKDKVYQLPSLMVMNTAKAAAWVGTSIVDLALYAGFGMLAIGVIDYFYQWWEHERSLMMSKQEVKDEYKQLEGDPQTKGRIKSIQRKMSQSRMMAAVKDADVVIRNPQHYAVALKYKVKENVSPIVIAKGVDLVALRIINEAQKYNIELVENPPLARALFAAADVGDEIPEEFWVAVAEILSHIYSLRNVHIVAEDAKRA